MPDNTNGTQNREGTEDGGAAKKGIFSKVYDVCFRDRSAAWTGIFTGFLALFTAVLVLFTSKLYEVGKSTDETARSSQRAFLSFSSIGLGVRLSDVSKNWTGQEFSLNWINTGNTPASEAVIQTNGQPWPTDLPKGFEFPLLPEKVTAVVGPKGTYGTNVQLSKDLLASAWSGKSRIFFWGTVVYKDVFPSDPDRVSEFCVEMTHITMGNLPSTSTPLDKSVQLPQPMPQPFSIDAPTTAIVNAQWQTCREHNCYDEGCKDYSLRVKESRTQ